jgi:TRAP-type C4-dicarboxylate transport system substrate-binding protein
MKARRKLARAAGVILAAGLAHGAAVAQEIKLTFADQNSPTGWGPRNALTPWVKQVEEATKGKLKLQVYPSQTLVKGIDMWKAASAGTIDIGWCVQSYWPDNTPLSDVISLPGLPFKTAEKTSEVLWKIYEKFPAIQAEYKQVVPLLLYTATPFFIISSKKQIKTLEDAKGMKVRIVGGPATEHAKALGIVPTPMPMPDVYQALDKGVIDGAGAPWEAVHAFRLYEVGKYVTIAPLATVYFSICANRAKIQSLPAEVRAQLMSVSGLAGSKFWGKSFFDTAEAGVYEDLKKANRNIERYALPANEAARWAKLAEPVHEEWVKRMEARGVKEAREILNTTKSMLSQ